MTSTDVERVGEARRRLRAMIARRADPAVRILELDAPSPNTETLAVNRRFCVLAGLSERAKRAIGETVQAMYDNATGASVLSGTVVIDGDHQPMHQPRPEADAQTAGATAIFRDHLDAVGANSIAWADPVDLRAVAAALETAIGLTSAVLRGADFAAREQRTAGMAPAEEIDLTTVDDARAEIDAALATLGRVGSRPELFDELEGLLVEVNMTTPIVRDDSAVEQYSAAIQRLLPTDSAATRAELEAKLDFASRARDAHRLERAVFVDRIVVVLDELGVDADSASAVERAERVLVEREEIERLRRRLEEQLETRTEGGSVGIDAATPTDATRSAESSERSPSPSIEADPVLQRRRSQLRRRLQSQQRLLAATREQLAFASRDTTAWSELPGRTVTPTNGEGRPLPILVEDPTVDLPSRHAASALSVLLRLSELCQVICISDDPDLARWSDEVGDRVGYVVAGEWFADDEEPC